MKNLTTAVLMTIVTTVLFGLAYPLVITGLAQVIFPENANGQLIRGADGKVIGSRLLGQPFVSKRTSQSCNRKTQASRCRLIWLPPPLPASIHTSRLRRLSFRFRVSRT